MIFTHYRLTVIIMILVLCCSGCAVLRPAASGPVSAPPKQQATESPTVKPIDELIRPDYDVKASILWDINGDGVKETVSAGEGDAREIGYDILLSVSDGGGFNTITIDTGYFETADYLVTPGGAPCVIVCCGYEDDYFSTYLVSFDGLKPVLHGSVDGITESVSGSDISVKCWQDVFGTWPCWGYYGITDDYSFALHNDCYYIDASGLDPLVTKSEFPVELWDDGNYIQTTLKAGTSIIPFMTDGKTYFKFWVKEPGTLDYPIVIINFTVSDGVCFIGGISEFDCFEEVPYAG